MSTNYVQSPTMYVCQCVEGGSMCRRYAGHAFDNGQYCVWLCQDCWKDRCGCKERAAAAGDERGWQQFLGLPGEAMRGRMGAR